MISFIKALIYVAFHPYDVLYLTVVRRYADAQKNFIGELYEGLDRNAKMIGVSCDSWPLNADHAPLNANPRVCWKEEFLAPLPPNTLRVGAMEPKDNKAVQDYVAMRRFCPIRVTVLNRFVEYILESDHVR